MSDGAVKLITGLMIVVVHSANETDFIVSFAEQTTTQLPDLLIDSQPMRPEMLRVTTSLRLVSVTSPWLLYLGQRFGVGIGFAVGLEVVALDRCPLG